MLVASIDTETTGLDPQKNDLLEVGVVLDNLANPENMQGCPAFRALIINPRKEYRITAFPGQAKRDLWREIEEADEDTLNDEGWYVEGETKYESREDPASLPGVGESSLVRTSLATHYCRPAFLEHAFEQFLAEHYMAESGKRRLNVIGKNFDGLDRLFLEPLLYKERISFRKRVLDPAPLFWRQGDETLPDLQTCLERAGSTEIVPHTAVDDAMLTLWLVRRGLSKAGLLVL